VAVLVLVFDILKRLVNGAQFGGEQLELRIASNRRRSVALPEHGSAAARQAHLVNC
jgi:hypothetical protein